MATNQKHVESQIDTEEAIEAALGKTESYLQKNGSKLLIILAVIVLAVGGYIGYKHIYVANKIEKAGEMMYVAEQNFIAEAYQVALDGDGNNAGFLQVISNYGGTPQGNIANHYAGVCYVKLGQMDNALKYLQGYKPVGGVPGQIINAQNKGLIGDVYVQKGDYSKAAAAFEDAVKLSENNLMTTPYMLKKLGMVYEKQGQKAKAVEAYQKVKDQFPASMEAHDIDKYIGAVEQR